MVNSGTTGFSMPYKAWKSRQSAVRSPRKTSASRLRFAISCSVAKAMATAFSLRSNLTWWCSPQSWQAVGSTPTVEPSSAFSPPPMRLPLLIYCSLRGLSLLFLSAMLAQGDTPNWPSLPFFYGLDWIATVPPTVRLTAGAFDRENTGVVYGWIGAAHQLGAGAIRTSMGAPRWAFVVAGVLCFPSLG